MTNPFMPTIKLVREYRDLISQTDEVIVDTDMCDDASRLWDRIGESFADIPTGLERDLIPHAVSVRGMGFPFRGKSISFKNAIPEYSLTAIARELAGWSPSTPYPIALEKLRKIEATGADALAEVKELFVSATDATQASSDRPYVYVDLETTGGHPAVAEIIECGLQIVTGPDEVESYNSLYSLEDESAILEDGTLPFAECHGITPDMIAGKGTFAEDDFVREVLQNPNAVIVAHNLEFEMRWFSHCVPGFMDHRSPYFGFEAGTDEQPAALDTRFATALLTDAPNATLKSLVEWAGAKYEDAHRALNDVEMMRSALTVLVDRMNES